MIGVVGARAIDIARIEHRREQLRALERQAFRLALSLRDALREGGELAVRLRPIPQRAEHRGPSGLAGDAGRVVDLLADEEPRARFPARLETQQLVAHGLPFTRRGA